MSMPGAARTASPQTPSHEDGFLERAIGAQPAARREAPLAVVAEDQAPSLTIRRLAALLLTVWAAVIIWEIVRHTVLAPWLSPNVRFEPAQTLAGAAVLGMIGTVLTLTLGRAVLANETALQRFQMDLRGTLRTLRETNVATLSALADAIDARDPYTRRHSDEAAEMATAVARGLGLPEHDVETVRLAAILHDIGKLGTPDRVLCKTGPLTDDERAVIRRHPDIGADIVGQIPFLRRVADVVRHHEERYDGTGYPAGLAGEAIPTGSRIVAVVDAYSAMTTDRPYRKALTHGQALEELRRHSGTQFCPVTVAAFIRVMDGRPLGRLLPRRTWQPDADGGGRLESGVGTVDPVVH